MAEKYTKEQEEFFKRMAKRNGVTVEEYKRHFEERQRADRQTMEELYGGKSKK